MILTKNIVKEINIDFEIKSRIDANCLDQLLIVVPTNRKLRNLKKIIIQYYENNPVEKLYIDTLTTLSTKLLSSIKNFITLSEAAASVLIRESSEEIKLNYFSQYNKNIPFGTLDKIRNVISEYKRNGVHPDQILIEAEKLTGGEQKKAIDIANIYRQFKDKCYEYSALEIGDIYSDLLSLKFDDFQNVYEDNYPNVKEIFFIGFDEFTFPEIKLINRLSSLVSNNLYINFDYYDYNFKLFQHLDSTYNKLKEFEFKRIVDKTPFSNSSFVDIIRTNLFKGKDITAESKFKDHLFKLTAPNRIEEVELIASKIKELIIDCNVSPDDICVTFNIIGNYSNIVRDIFFKYGIPLNLTDRISLKSTQPVVAIINLLELVEYDFNYLAISRVLTNGFLEFNNIDLNNIIYVAQQLKITSGLSNWQNQINDAIALLQFQEDFQSDINKEYKKLKKAESDINFLSELLKPFKKKNTTNEFLDNLKKLLIKLKLPSKILISENDNQEILIKSVSILFQTLSEVLFLIHKKNNINKEQKYSTKYFIDQIRTISNWARFNVKEKNDFGVLVTSINEIRGLSFDYLFLGGLCDGDLPTKYSPEIFFSGTFRKHEKIHLTEERYHFYQTLNTWNKQLYLTIPKNDVDKELVESNFVKEIEKLFSFTILEPNKNKPIFNIEELLISYGKNLLSNNNLTHFANYGIGLEKLNKNIQVAKYRKDNPLFEDKYNGFLLNEENNNSALIDYFNEYSQKQFSISQLETLAKCPFKFWIERILELKPLKEPSEEAEPIELGNLLHSILFEFYSKIRKENILINNCSISDFNNIKKLLFDIAQKKIDQLKLHSPFTFFEKEKILGINGLEENSILYKFLENEKNNDTDFVPDYFEFQFGEFSKRSADNKPLIPPLKFGNLNLRGKIDRIDIDYENKLFNIIDYKLKGKKPTNSELLEGLSLQLPIYLIAVKYILEYLGFNDFNGFKMIIYSLKYGEDFGPSSVNLSRKNTNNEILNDNLSLIEKTKLQIEKLHQKLLKGEFNLSQLEKRNEKVCNYCDFPSFCRKQEIFND